MSLQGSRAKEKTVLFVCVENAARSQMAEGFSHTPADKKNGWRQWNSNLT